MPQPSEAEDVLVSITESWERQVAAIQAVPGGDREVPGPFGWSIKDVVANIMGWERELIAILERTPPHEAMGLDPTTYAAGETDVINAIMYAKYRAVPFSEVWAEAVTTHAQLVALVASLSGDAISRPLTDEQDQPANEDRVTVLDWIAAGTYDHYRDHARDLAIIAEQAALARVSGGLETVDPRANLWVLAFLCLRAGEPDAGTVRTADLPRGADDAD